MTTAADRRACVVGRGAQAQSLMEMLQARGRTAVTLDVTDGDTDADAVARAFAALDRRSLGLDAVIWAETKPALAAPRPLAALTPEEWEALVAAPLRTTLAVLRAAHDRLADGGRILVLVPSIAMDGAAAGHVAWTTVAEGQRSLVRSAARVWSDRRHAVNCLAVAPTVLVPGAQADRAGLPPRALQAPSMSDVADIIDALLDDRFAAVTGATIAVDGGRWMTP